VKKYDKNKHNLKLFKKLDEIEAKGYRTVFGKIIPNYLIKGKGKNRNSVKLNIKDIAQENLHMYKRLLDQQPTYDINKLINDYANNHLFYKKYACRYPSIDFYKEKKPKKKFLFHSSDAKKNINKPICKTESNYSPKISDMFSTKYYLNNNINYNFERFPIIKKNRLKKRKKKFKDFDYQDLKNLIKDKVKFNNNIKEQINKNQNNEISNSNDFQIESNDKKKANVLNNQKIEEKNKDVINDNNKDIINKLDEQKIEDNNKDKHNNHKIENNGEDIINEMNNQKVEDNKDLINDINNQNNEDNVKEIKNDINNHKIEDTDKDIINDINYQKIDNK
jgi:hypothetical protein